MNMEKIRKDYDNVLWAGKKCILGLPISFTTYIITETALYSKVGLINVREDEIELYRVFDKQMTFTLFQRIVKCGTITLMSKDSDTPAKRLISVRNPRDVKRILDEAVKTQRDKYYVQGRDMIGSNASGKDCGHYEIDDTFVE